MAIYYDQIICKNPQCSTGSFVPKRSNQQFCDNKCKDHFHNQKRKIEAETTYAKAKQLRQNHKVLERLYQNPTYRESVPELILVHEGFDLCCFTDVTVNEKTNRHTRWSYDYGIEHITDDSARTFIIYKR